jgi:hypothetical protein
LKQLSKLVAISAAAIACSLASLPANAQTTYTAGSTAPSWTTVLSTTLTTTATSPTYDEVATFQYGVNGLEKYNSANRATTELNDYGIDGTQYASAAFTETAGFYNVAMSTTGYYSSPGIGGTLENYIYDAAFNASKPTTGVYSAESDYGNTADYQELLPAATAGTVVDSDFYPTGYEDTSNNDAPITNLGTDAITISELNALNITANSATGTSISVTDAGSGVLGTSAFLSSLSIFGLNDTYDGDLVATLTHDGTTISIFDRPGADAANYGAGTWGLFSNEAAVGSVAAASNVYSFADSGANLASFDDDETVAGGYYALSNSGTANGGANNDATDFEAFNGESETGTWTLNIADLSTVDLAYFTGFAINLEPAPEASTVISSVLAVSFMIMLVWKARRNRFEVTALESDDNE